MKKRHNIVNADKKIHFATNLVLAVMVLSVGSLCLPSATETVADEKGSVYRSAPLGSNNVSLMFNVYWGTEEVYRILDILQEYDARATFFIGGCWADDNTDCLRDIFAAGHEIGNHGYFHKDHSKLNLLENQKEISSCNRFIELCLGEAPTLFAPPSGAYNDAVLEACDALDMRTILWSKDTVDWRDKNAALIYTRATQGIRGGEFILMHPMKETADALEDILKYYARNSLGTCTVSQNLQANG